MNNSTRVKVYRVILILSTVFILLFSSVLPSFAASGPVYSKIPQPFFDEFSGGGVVESGGYYYLVVIQMSQPAGSIDFVAPYINFNIDVNGFYYFYGVASENTQVSFIFNVYNALTGDCIQKGVESTKESVRIKGFNTKPDSVLLFNCTRALPVDNSIGTTNIVWNDNTDPNTFLTWLNKINSNLDSIDTNTSSSETLLENINSELTLFSDSFDAYKDVITSAVDVIQQRLLSVKKSLEELVRVSHSIDENISNIWNDISQKNEEQSRFYEQNIGGFGNNPDDVNNNILNGYVQPGDQGGGSFGGFEGGQQGFNDGLNFIDNFGDPGSQSLMLSTFRIGSLFIAPMLPLIVGFAVVFILLHKAGE